MLLAACAAGALAPDLRSQACDPIDPDDPGDFLPRPYGGFSAMGESSTQLPNAEIAHAVVLPPPLNEPDLVRVLLICRTNCADAWGDGAQAGAVNRSFLWKPLENPGGVEELVGPTSGHTGSADAFCSGHVVVADGSVLVVGGLDYMTKCNSPEDCITMPYGATSPVNPDERLPVGHRYIYKLDTSVDPPAWVVNNDWPTVSMREHWYPTVKAMHDGSVFIGGHFGAPSPACPFPSWPYPETGGFVLSRLFELFDPISTGSVEFNNYAFTTCASTTELDLGDYPRMHLLSTGDLVHTNALAAHPEEPDTRLMDFTAGAPCASSLFWEQPGSNPEHDPDVHRDGGSSVHFVVLDATAPGGRRDLVYDFGGIEEFDDDPCQNGTAVPVIYSSVQRFDGVEMSWAQRAALPVSRVNHNAVIMPTGTVFVPGGMTYNSTSGCTPVYQAVEYYPDDFFGLPLSNVWRTRDGTDCPRLYHSVAFLLPDGRVAVAGGKPESCIGGKNSQHTVEIYEPPYYSSGSRPSVSDWPEPAEQSIEIGGLDFELSVTLSCESATIERVVLIRSSSVTHAFDMNQRYVQLSIGIEGITGTFPNFTVPVVPPETGFVAPPGYYLLFVIDSNGIPSVGRWVHVAVG
ncbi:MAG: galactose oxidase-like domain-containing protein [Planctomycetota bacterium]